VRDLSARYGHVQRLAVKLGADPAHVSVPAKRDASFKVRGERACGHARGVEGEGRGLGVPAVGGDDQQTTAARRNGYGRVVKVGHAVAK
jgi:hypothetical protein